MEWKDSLQKSLNEDSDDILREKIKCAARAAGAGEKQAQRLTADMDQVRQVIAGLKPSDLESIVQAVGEENLKKILSGISGEQG